MSSYLRKTKHPQTGEYEMAAWLDDHFGPHQYGVRFQDGQIFNADLYELPTKNDNVDADWDKFFPSIGVDEPTQALPSATNSNSDTDTKPSEPTKGFREGLEALLNNDCVGEVRLEYPDGHSEIKDAKVLLVDDICNLVLELIGEDERVPERGGTGPAIARAVDDRIERIKSANNLRQALRERVKE